MKKVRNTIALILISAMAAGIFGIIHDQVSYSVSHEYYTKLKFEQFQIPDYFHDRVGVSIVGWNATWWFGLILGIILLVFIRKDLSNADFLSKGIRTIGVILLATFAISILGLIIGSLFFDPNSSNWIIPEEVYDKGRFLAVGTMHTFSYFGGILGLVFGIWFYKNLNRTETREGK